MIEEFSVKNWKKMLEKFLTYCFIFLLGILSSMLIFYFLDLGIEKPLGFSGFFSTINNNSAPSDWIKEEQIKVYENAIVINIEGASISRYAPTGSMLPVLDEKSNGIRIVPKNEEQIKIGDIVTFEKDKELIVHRVIEKGRDEKGAWFTTKGDNSQVEDGKIYFSDIRYVTIGVLW